jgi:HTH-type transcriptional regulator / antitoxin HigA
MGTEKRIYSDLAIPPGEYLAEVLGAKRMSQAELARRTGRPVQAINEIIKGEKALTPETALQLERALSVPAHIWTGLESRYQLVRARQEEKKLIRKELPYLKKTPYKQLTELGCVSRTRDSERKIRELHRFYGVSSLDNLPETWAGAPSFRRSPKWDASRYALAAWLRCAELQAQNIDTVPFDRSALRTALNDLRAMTRMSPRAFPGELANRLAAGGVALVLQPHFPKTYAQGATFWLGTEKAVLVLSLRGRWADVFWFSLFHEIGHLLLHRKTTFIDDGDVSAERAELEREADRFAGETLIPSEELRAFVGKSDLSTAAVRAFSESMGVAAGIVVGRLQHEGAVSHDSGLNRLRQRYEWEERR